MSASIDRKANPNDPYFAQVKNKSAPTIKQSDKKNVLNRYRSSTYNFTLAALRKDDINDPSVYRNSALDLIIIKSGGKGIQGISTNVSGVDRVVGQTVTEFREGGRLLGVDKKDIIEKDFSGTELVKGFNENSPGRFDLFIDDVEIETLMAFTPASGTTLPTSVKFTVIEPYSINGFIEALHVSAIAAGYPNYTQASFLLKMEFVGYPDDDTTVFKNPQVVENSTRYFPIKFTGIEVEVTERGTRYRCAAIPWSDAAFGQPNSLKRPVTMAGNTVGDILKNLIKNLNDQLREDDKAAKSGTPANDSDEYEIVFPTRTDSGFDYTQINDIGKTSLKTILRDPAIYKFKDPGEIEKKQTPQQNDSNPDEIKLHPTSGSPPQIQFAENQKINEIIAAVIRDSEYIRKILKESKVDGNGFIDYFAIKAEVTNKSTIDPVSRKPFQKYRFSVIPYKVHFTRIPSLKGQKFDPGPITKLSLREYNYIYTGNNVDILNFKLNFNTLFFEAIPLAMGNNDQPGAASSAGQPNDTKRQLKGDDISNQKSDQNFSPTLRQVPQPVTTDGANASQRSTDPYYALAKNMHSAIIDSNASMLTGNIDILGDPFYLVTGGIGNYDSKPSGVQGLTQDGEADHLQGEVLITINFRNPVDINPLQKGGNFYFETEKLPFSGVYMVTKAVSSFKDGIFKQSLDIIRVPGQIVGRTRETVLADTTVETPKKESQQVPSTTRGENQGVAASDASIADMLLRGLPSPGLPGAFSNFVGAVGGLGGSDLLSQVSGLIPNGLNSLAAANSVFGNVPASIDQLSSGIRLKTSGLVSEAQSRLSSAASIVGASNTLKSGFSLPNVSETLGTELQTAVTNLTNRVAIPGSGIGEGATVLVDRVTSAAGDLALNIKQSDALNSISAASSQITQISGNAISAATALGKDASLLVSSVGDKITGLSASLPTDPTAIAAKFGINPSQLSGLGENIKSKVLDQLSGLSKKLPENADIGIATARGLALNTIPSDKLGNIPATAPYATAPKPAVDRQYLSSIASKGPQALADAFGVSNVSAISGEFLSPEIANSVLGQLKDTINNPLSKLTSNLNGVDSAALGGKLASAQSLVNSVIPNAASVESNLGFISSAAGSAITDARNLSMSVSAKFGSAAESLSPLTKLFNK